MGLEVGVALRIMAGRLSCYTQMEYLAASFAGFLWSEQHGLGSGEGEVAHWSFQSRGTDEPFQPAGRAAAVAAPAQAENMPQGRGTRAPARAPSPG